MAHLLGIALLIWLCCYIVWSGSRPHDPISGDNK